MSTITLPIISDDEWSNCSNYLSKSRVNTFELCQIKYKLQYIDKVLPYEETHATSIGTRFHEFAEVFCKECQSIPQYQWLDCITSDFTPEEVPMLEFFINNEKFRSKCGFKPIALEHAAIDHKNKLRGVIDRIDLINENTIQIIEYKTSKSIKEKTLKLEFAFYDLLIDSIKELHGYNRTYQTIYPRLEKCIDYKPSKRQTILNRINLINNAKVFKPLCKSDYALPWCDICTPDQIALYNEAYAMVDGPQVLR